MLKKFGRIPYATRNWWIYNYVINCIGFPGGSVVKNPPAAAGDSGLIPGLERSSRKGNGKPLQNSCLGNPMDWGVWWVQSMGSQRVRHDWVTCHFFFFYFFYPEVKVEVLVAQTCPTLWDPMDCSLPGSSAHGILQSRKLEWVAIAISFSRGFSRPRDWTWVSTREACDDINNTPNNTMP